MVRYYRRNYRRNYGRPRSSYRRTGRRLNVRQKVQVKNLVSRRMESKYYISNYNTGVDYAGVVVDLCQLTYGQADISRIGDQVHFERLDFVFNWRASPTAFNVCRLLFFQWRPLSTPTVGDILDTNGPTPVGTSNAPFFLYNWDNRLEYKILYSKVFYSDSEDGPALRYASGSIYGKNVSKRIRFNSTTPTPGYNHIYALMISDDGATPYPIPYLRTRLVYKDA